jgi:hypothetical protein
MLVFPAAFFKQIDGSGAVDLNRRSMKVMGAQKNKPVLVILMTKANGKHHSWKYRIPLWEASL